MTARGVEGPFCCHKCRASCTESVLPHLQLLHSCHMLTSISTVHTSVVKVEGAVTFPPTKPVSVYKRCRPQAACAVLLGRVSSSLT